MSHSISIEQNPTGYRYSVEPFLLANFVDPYPGQRVLEVGTGCGILPLLLTSREPGLDITAVEIQESLVRPAIRNVAQSGRAGIRIHHADFLEMARDLPPSSFDWIVSNPPYRKRNSGRINPDPEKAIARHELKLSLPTLIAAAAPLLKPEGKLVLAYPPLRREEWMTELERNGLTPRRRLTVHGHHDTEPRILLVEATRTGNAGRCEDRTLVMYNPDGSYTGPMQAIYERFDYSGRSHRLREK
ncbi:tRNA1(Val) (adenine(37)-N6)-methyltransferase [Nitrospina gracilis]|uniref:tRNA1(Val) (adenine(37)-N6)-methyltransferase n=1 Tax=Nitrospina gracilis TaxID=35801 RepID=UPI001EFF9BFF|nr:methyltransferase [Nitrospina gracilis]MCF8719842.1 tRNA1Val (adenine37-N6)-methyltransferase [Nitrospina gracilis Nb-211]